MKNDDGSYIREIGKIEQYDIQILDDFGMLSLNASTKWHQWRSLRTGRKKKTIIVSQLPVAKWYEMIGKSTIAEAILDRSIQRHIA